MNGISCHWFITSFPRKFFKTDQVGTYFCSYVDWPYVNAWNALQCKWLSMVCKLGNILWEKPSGSRGKHLGMRKNKEKTRLYREKYMNRNHDSPRFKIKNLTKKKNFCEKIRNNHERFVWVYQNCGRQHNVTVNLVPNSGVSFESKRKIALMNFIYQY